MVHLIVVQTADGAAGSVLLSAASSGERLALRLVPWAGGSALQAAGSPDMQSVTR
ncbi:hypothetical protein [Rhizobium sp. BR 362]|uniref:hypothetical protein n=1 Tax=Rhizobium sp. BR 362 TaxID=3040670 RepID=UPI002F4120E5